MANNNEFSNNIYGTYNRSNLNCRSTKTLMATLKLQIAQSLPPFCGRTANRLRGRYLQQILPIHDMLNLAIRYVWPWLFGQVFWLDRCRCPAKTMLCIEHTILLCGCFVSTFFCAVGVGDWGLGFCV